MFTRGLKHFKEALRLRNYIVTVHAIEEMDDDGFTIFDVEHCILHGEISERQKEHKTAEWKFLVHGVTFQQRGSLLLQKQRLRARWSL